MAQKFITTSVRLTKEQYEFLRRTNRNVSKSLRDIVQGELVTSGTINTIQKAAMDQMYLVGNYSESPLSEWLVDTFHENLINSGIIIPYDYCEKYLREKENP
jgi:hypothetical protein